MRYRLTILMLLLLSAMLPVMYLPAAPAPEPAYAILDIGPPLKDWSLEKYCKWEIDVLNGDGLFCIAYNIDADLRKLEADSRRKNIGSWVKRNLRIKEEGGGRRLRLTFHAGTRAEQATIINALLHANLKANDDHIKRFEKTIRSHEESIADLERRIKWGLFPHEHDSYRKGINQLRSTLIPECRAEIDRLKQFTVIKWAK